jgi:hypothetical protein
LDELLAAGGGVESGELQSLASPKDLRNHFPFEENRNRFLRLIPELQLGSQEGILIRSLDAEEHGRDLGGHGATNTK